MSDTSDLVPLIDDALAALPKKVLASKFVEGAPIRQGMDRAVILFAPPKQFRPAVRAAFEEWMFRHVAFVLEGLGQSERGRDVFAKMLHKPWLVCKDDEADRLLSREMPTEARLEHVKRRLWVALDATLRHRMPRIPPPEGQSRKGAESAAPERPRTDARRRADAFWSVPAAWLWSLWHEWELATDCRPIPGIPEWPGLKQHPSYSILDSAVPFLAVFRPGEFAYNLKRALEELRVKLAAAQAGKGERIGFR